MRSVATFVFMVGLLLVVFLLTEVIVWGCALLGAFIFSNLISGVIWMGIEKVERRAVKSAKIMG
jgi:hypothetical protein